ncbi:MAG: hypothetical protein JWM80_2281, partial [Cyanobacteria bacterium RYN_339]|nr:hypothetical protein [Cyanobacteria bacterium RYN_339]
MNDPAFLYVLISSVTPDRLCLGRLDEHPRQHAAALTAPWESCVLAYAAFYPDAGAAFAATAARLGAPQEPAFFDGVLADAIEVMLAQRPENLAPGTAARHENERQAVLAVADARATFDEAELAYYGTRSVPKDPRRALALYETAARSGVPKAYLKLGFMETDRHKAFELFRAGAMHGCDECVAELAIAFAAHGEAAGAERCWTRYLTAVGSVAAERPAYALAYLRGQIERGESVQHRERLSALKGAMQRYYGGLANVCRLERDSALAAVFDGYLAAIAREIPDPA